MCLAIPGEIEAVRQRDGIPFGKVRFGGIVREVCLAYQPEAAVGDFVLVHVGFAIATLDPQEAARTWALLEELGQLVEVREELCASAEEGGEAIGFPSSREEPPA